MVIFGEEALLIWKRYGLNLWVQTVCTCVCVFFFLYLPHTEYKNLYSTSKERTFLGSMDILAGLHNVKGVFKD